MSRGDRIQSKRLTSGCGILKKRVIIRSGTQDKKKGGSHFDLAKWLLSVLQEGENIAAKES